MRLCHTLVAILGAQTPAHGIKVLMCSLHPEYVIASWSAPHQGRRADKASEWSAFMQILDNLLTVLAQMAQLQHPTAGQWCAVHCRCTLGRVPAYPGERMPLRDPACRRRAGTPVPAACHPAEAALGGRRHPICAGRHCAVRSTAVMRWCHTFAPHCLGIKKFSMCCRCCFEPCTTEAAAELSAESNADSQHAQVRAHSSSFGSYHSKCP